MSYSLVISERVRKDLELHKKSGDKRLVKKIYTLFTELAEHPTTGTGHPEPLRHMETNIWSRRIDRKHRLVYQIKDMDLIVIAISAYGHYRDK
ncbi:MAG: Txe/YoeB family addiction module toxin [Bacteroidales bacterium]|jgi:toxin YoeB|nr:Txe/YoeB family addiction module toxin [Bacteroidales bacterium]HHV40430.1 Txe/YoeB family addiction module toxin [Bacteroidales bacterium]